MSDAFSDCAKFDREDRRNKEEMDYKNILTKRETVGDVYFSWDGLKANKGFIAKVYTCKDPMEALVIQTDGEDCGNGYIIPILNIYATPSAAIEHFITTQTKSHS